MVFGSVEDCNQDTHNMFRIVTVRGGRFRIGGGGNKKRACKIPDGGYDDTEEVAAIPETIVRGLITEHLSGWSLSGDVTSRKR